MKTNDIVPGILEKIKNEYGIKVSESDALKNIRELAAKKEITYKDAQTASQEIGKILSEAYGDELTAEILPNGRMYYNIANRIVRPTMEQAYFDIADITELTQNVLNEEAGIGIKAIRPILKQDKIDGIVDRLAEAEKFEDVAWMLQAPVNTFCQSIVDDAVQANAEFQYKAGMQPKIIRRTAGNCCEWCSRLAGTYSYPNVPKDVYRRHNNCNCTVEFYTVEGKRQDVWSKRWKEDEETLRKRRTIGIQDTPKNTIVNLSDVKLITQNSEHIKKLLSKELDKLTIQEKEALNEYTGFLAQRLNNAIATGKNLKQFNQTMNELDSALNKGIIPEDIIVQRKTIPEFMNIPVKGKISEKDIVNLRGQILTNEIYTSAALEPFTYLGRNVIIEMKVPAGYKGALYIRDIAKEKFKIQNEILFKRGMSYLVKSVEYINGQYIVTAEVIL